MKNLILSLFMMMTCVLRAQLVTLIDSKTKESVNFEKVTHNKIGLPITDLDVDGIIYAKKDGNYYKRVMPDNKINVQWFGKDSDAIQKAINVSLHDFGSYKLQIFGVYMPAGHYNIDKTINVSYVNGFSLSGQGASTMLSVNKNLSSVFDFDGIAYSYIGNFNISSGNGSFCDKVIKLRWGDGITNNGKRSTTKNKFENINILIK